MALPVSFYNRSLADNTLKKNGQPETTSFSVPITTLTAANVVAQSALASAFAVAVAGLTLGAVYQSELVFDRTKGTGLPSSNPLAQRENKYLCRAHDAVTNQKFQVSLGTADLSKHMANSEFVDLTAGDGLALKDAWEDFVVSPFNSSNATVLDTVQFVGRNT